MLRKIISVIFILLSLVQCQQTKKIVDWDKKEAEWRETISVNNDYYQTIVQVPIGADKSESLRKAETLANMKFAEEIQNDLSSSLLWERLNLEERKIEAANRAMKKMLAKEISNLELESSFNSGHTFFAAYKINKKDFKTEYENKKNAAIKQSKLKWSEGIGLIEKREPQQAADVLCEALIYIENYLGNDLSDDTNLENRPLDQKIIESLKALRNDLSINMDPIDTIILNFSNDYIGILNFEVLQNKEKTGNVNLSVDVAGIRQDVLTVSGYSVLVNNLPMRLNSPYVKIRSDLLRNLRLNGNELSQLIYQTIPIIASQVRIKREFQNVNVESEGSDFWSDYAREMLLETLENSDVTIVDNSSENSVSLMPSIKITSEEGSGFYKLTAQWQIKVGETQVNGVRLVATSNSERNAQDDIINRLNEQMKRVVIDDLLSFLIDSKNK